MPDAQSAVSAARMVMNADEIRALAKEKLGRDITEEEAQAYLDDSVELLDEALELASGGCECDHKCVWDDYISEDGRRYFRCPKCGYIGGWYREIFPEGE